MKETKDRRGVRYDSLVAICLVPKPEWSKNKYAKFWWNCQCDCGRQTIKEANELDKDRPHSCGCKNPSKFQELTGKRFGRWVVVGHAESKDNSTLWNCKCDCGVEKKVGGRELRNGKSSSCGCYAKEQSGKRTGPNSAVWKGGRYITQAGYVLVKQNGHPNARHDGYINEHSLVMANHLDRPLTRDERVHHKDGNKQNNALSNLELWSSTHPSGQRPADLVAFAWKVIAKYDPSHSACTKTEGLRLDRGLGIDQ